MGQNKGKYFTLNTTTNAKGEFEFDKLPTLDSASFVVQVLNKKGEKGTIGLKMNDFNPPALILPKNKFTANSSDSLNIIQNNFISTKKQETDVVDVDGIALKEVKVTAKKSIKGSKNLNGSGNYDDIITEEGFKRAGKRVLIDILKQKFLILQKYLQAMKK